MWFDFLVFASGMMLGWVLCLVWMLWPVKMPLSGGSGLDDNNFE